jgi:hypothetical protein
MDWHAISTIRPEALLAVIGQLDSWIDGAN